MPNSDLLRLLSSRAHPALAEGRAIGQEAICHQFTAFHGLTVRLCTHDLSHGRQKLFMTEMFVLGNVVGLAFALPAFDQMKDRVHDVPRRKRDSKRIPAFPVPGLHRHRAA